MRLKIMNTKEKGRRVEIERKKYLEDKGYKVELAPIGTMFSKKKDFYRYFDVIAFNKDHFLLEQIKSNNSGGAIKLIKGSGILKLLPPNTVVRVVIHVKFKRFEKKWREIDIK